MEAAQESPAHLAQRILLDNINTVPVYVEHFSDVVSPTSVYATGTMAHLQVVAEDGLLFTEQDLGDMSLEKNDVALLEDLCKRRFNLLCNAYLTPDMHTRVEYVPEFCCVDEHGKVHVTFFLREPISQPFR